MNTGSKSFNLHSAAKSLPLCFIQTVGVAKEWGTVKLDIIAINNG